MRATAEEKRERMVGVKCTEQEYEHIRQAAFAARKSMGAFLRDLALASMTRPAKRTNAK